VAAAVAAVVWAEDEVAAVVAVAWAEDGVVERQRETCDRANGCGLLREIIAALIFVFHKAVAPKSSLSLRVDV